MIFIFCSSSSWDQDALCIISLILYEIYTRYLYILIFLYWFKELKGSFYNIKQEDEKTAIEVHEVPGSTKQNKAENSF